MIAILFLFGCLFLFAGYRFYGRWLSQRLDLRDDRPTPAHTRTDGIDYVPTRDMVLFGHHFSSIAGAGPIVGPVIAGLAFGWGPAMLWILLGAVFIGGVHDFTAMVASLRHQAYSIGHLCRRVLSPTAYYLFLVFIWFTLVYVLIVFLDLTALSFAPAASAAIDPERLRALSRQGGAVATAAVLYIALAALFGWLHTRRGIAHHRLSLVLVPMVFVGLWIGRRFPLDLAQWLGGAGPSPTDIWRGALLAYCLVASILPVWLLLQPRDYLSSFLLYAALIGGGVGLTISSFMGRAPLAYPAFLGWNAPQLGGLFPMLFITIACGAVSGFHAIVASGTTSKQLDRESGALRIGYGGMLLEAVLALVALAAVMTLKEPTREQPVAVFAAGLGRFLSVFGLSSSWAAMFALMAVSTFLLTTLDTCTRLTRFIVEEFFGRHGIVMRWAASAISLVVPALLVFRTVTGPNGQPMAAWKAIWPAFGATNQLLAALALLVVYAWLKQEKRPAWYVLIPTLIMCVTSITALTELAGRHLLRGGSPLVGGICALLDVLAVYLIGATVASRLRHARRTAEPAEGPTE